MSSGKQIIIVIAAVIVIVVFYEILDVIGNILESIPFYGKIILGIVGFFTAFKIAEYLNDGR